MNIWLLGDSIRMQYEKYVKSKCPDIKVFAPSENCRFSSFMLNSLRFWLPSFEKPDIIFFNAGLWDTACLYVDDGPFTIKEQYVKNITSIARELSRHKVPIVFLTSTPVNAEQISAVATPSIDAPDAATVFKQDNQRINEYNQAVIEPLKAKNVHILDAFSLFINEREKYISKDGIHLNEAGTAKLGDAIVECINEILK